MKKMNKIKEYRKEKGITLKELSQQTNINFTTLRSYEYEQRNLNKMQLGTAIKIAKALNIHAEELIE
jgi:transcriptional regulator with XRE-family HTH domain